MAARLNKRLATQTRDAIQTSMLINRLYDHALGNNEMSATQVKAAETLLKKTLPDLKSTDIDMTMDAKVEVLPFEFVEPT